MSTTTTPIFRKNLRFEWEAFKLQQVLDEAPRDPKSFIGYLEAIQRMFGKSGLQEITIKLLHVKVGTQFIVQKELSDELSLVDFDNAAFEGLSWPAPSIEFYYEDPALASIIVQCSRSDGLLIELARSIWGKAYAARVPEWGLVGAPSLAAVCDNADAPTSCTVIHDAFEWHRALESGKCECTVDNGLVGLSTSDAEAREQHRLLNLSLKVLAYSGIPQFRPTPVTRKQMGRGPKAGVCGRPERPAFRTVYLPRIVRQSHGDGSAVGGAGREFRGRRGHIRHLRSEFYKHKKGTWIYIPPVEVADSDPNVVYKIRKAS